MSQLATDLLDQLSELVEQAGNIVKSLFFGLEFELPGQFCRINRPEEAE